VSLSGTDEDDPLSRNVTRPARIRKALPFPPGTTAHFRASALRGLHTRGGTKLDAWNSRLLYVISRCRERIFSGSITHNETDTWDRLLITLVRQTDAVPKGPTRQLFWIWFSYNPSQVSRHFVTVVTLLRGNVLIQARKRRRRATAGTAEKRPSD